MDKKSVLLTKMIIFIVVNVQDIKEVLQLEYFL
jgi:hypothetical protein